MGNIEHTELLNSQIPEPKTTADPTSLAEVLAKFPLRRPLNINESSALCYQILAQLRNHILETPLKISVHNLHYPTLSNILINEEGFANIRTTNCDSQTVSFSLHDWLCALSQTLQGHTVVTETKVSETFQSLIRNLCFDHFTYSQLLERITTWQNTCLYICSLTKRADSPLRDLKQRSSKAHYAKLLSREMREKQVTVNPLNQTISEQRQHSPDKQFMTTKKPCLQACAETEDRQAFKLWLEKWQHVNAEYLARQLIKNSPVNHHSPASQLTDLSSRLSPKINNETNMRNSWRQNRQQVKTTDEFGQKRLQTLVERPPREGNNYMNTIKSMYSNLISRPLIKLKNGLKGISEPQRTSNIPTGHAAMTLKELDQILRSPADEGTSIACNMNVNINSCHV